MMADLGADVIKVEDPIAGDYSRWLGPKIDGQSVFFRMNNRQKRSIIINLKEASGQAVLKKLAETADVLIEGFRPGVMARLNCDYDTLHAINPKLVYCALSGWGVDGPYAQLGNHDLNYVSTAGITGGMETPQPIGGQIGDIGGSYAGLSGILAALFRRERTGEGGFIDISLSESALPFALYGWVEGLVMGVPGGQGTLTGGRACYRIYRTLDQRYVSLGALEEKFWRNFCEAVGRKDLIEGYTAMDRQPYLIDELRAIFNAKTAAEWDELLGDVDCCFSLVKEPGAIAEDPHYQARGMLGQFADGTPWMRSPVRISASDPQPANLVPGYGEHTRAVLAEFGYSPTEIDALTVSGAVK